MSAPQKFCSVDLESQDAGYSIQVVSQEEYDRLHEHELSFYRGRYECLPVFLVSCFWTGMNALPDFGPFRDLTEGSSRELQSPASIPVHLNAISRLADQAGIEPLSFFLVTDGDPEQAGRHMTVSCTMTFNAAYIPGEDYRLQVFLSLLKSYVSEYPDTFAMDFQDSRDQKAGRLAWLKHASFIRYMAENHTEKFQTSVSSRVEGGSMMMSCRTVIPMTTERFQTSFSIEEMVECATDNFKSTYRDFLSPWIFPSARHSLKIEPISTEILDFESSVLSLPEEPGH